MIPWEVLGRARAPGGSEMVLRRRGHEYSIRIDGIDLMVSRQHASEEALAELGCAFLKGKPKACVLVGGLGLGYSLRAVLDRVAPSATVVVAEIMPEVVEWNRGPLAHLAGHPLDDKRVLVEIRDVGAVISSAHARFDAILLDVDNGPDAPVLPGNRGFYNTAGLLRLHRALRPGGRFALWSVLDDASFVTRLRAAGWTAQSQTMPARGHGARGTRHTVFVADTGIEKR